MSARHHARKLVAAPILLMLAAGCSDFSDLTGSPDEEQSECTLPGGAVFNGAARDGIPALTDPKLEAPTGAGAAYLRPYDRVVGLELGGEHVAIPLNILWWHEVVNLSRSGFQVVVTHCPLTGSTLVFDREPLQGTEFGVSGLLYQSNLILYDRGERESLWPQMARSAQCGPRIGTVLKMVAAVEIRWDQWRRLHPETLVVSSLQGYDREYRSYPYGSYDEPDNRYLLFPVDIDPRRPPKERVLGIPFGAMDGPLGDGGIAFPFGELAEAGRWGVAREDLEEGAVVVFWDGEGQAAMAHRPVLDGRILSFRATDQGIVDEQTGSSWNVEGLAVDGPLASKKLKPVPEAYVAFWFAWAAFHPRAALWEAS